MRTPKRYKRDKFSKVSGKGDILVEEEIPRLTWNESIVQKALICRSQLEDIVISSNDKCSVFPSQLSTNPTNTNQGVYSVRQNSFINDQRGSFDAGRQQKKVATRQVCSQGEDVKSVSSRMDAGQKKVTVKITLNPDDLTTFGEFVNCKEPRKLVISASPGAPSTRPNHMNYEQKFSVESISKTSESSGKGTNSYPTISVRSHSRQSCMPPVQCNCHKCEKDVQKVNCAFNIQSNANAARKVPLYISGDGLTQKVKQVILNNLKQSKTFAKRDEDDEDNEVDVDVMAKELYARENAGLPPNPNQLLNGSLRQYKDARKTSTSTNTSHVERPTKQIQSLANGGSHLRQGIANLKGPHSGGLGESPSECGTRYEPLQDVDQSTEYVTLKHFKNSFLRNAPKVCVQIHSPSVKALSINTQLKPDCNKNDANGKYSTYKNIEMSLRDAVIDNIKGSNNDDHQRRLESNANTRLSPLKTIYESSRQKSRLLTFKNAKNRRKTDSVDSKKLCEVDLRRIGGDYDLIGLKKEKDDSTQKICDEMIYLPEINHSEADEGDLYDKQSDKNTIEVKPTPMNYNLKIKTNDTGNASRKISADNESRLCRYSELGSLRKTKQNLYKNMRNQDSLCFVENSAPKFGLDVETFSVEIDSEYANIDETPNLPKNITDMSLDTRRSASYIGLNDIRFDSNGTSFDRGNANWRRDMSVFMINIGNDRYGGISSQRQPYCRRNLHRADCSRHQRNFKKIYLPNARKHKIHDRRLKALKKITKTKRNQNAPTDIADLKKYLSTVRNAEVYKRNEGPVVRCEKLCRHLYKLQLNPSEKSVITAPNEGGKCINSDVSFPQRDSSFQNIADITLHKSSRELKRWKKYTEMSLLNSDVEYASNLGGDRLQENKTYTNETCTGYQNYSDFTATNEKCVGNDISFCIRRIKHSKSGEMKFLETQSGRNTKDEFRVIFVGNMNPTICRSKPNDFSKRLKDGSEKKKSILCQDAFTNPPSRIMVDQAVRGTSETSACLSGSNLAAGESPGICNINYSKGLNRDEVDTQRMKLSQQNESLSKIHEKIMKIHTHASETKDSKVNLDKSRLADGFNRYCNETLRNMDVAIKSNSAYIEAYHKYSSEKLFASELKDLKKIKKKLTSYRNMKAESKFNIAATPGKTHNRLECQKKSNWVNSASVFASHMCTIRDANKKNLSKNDYLSDFKHGYEIYNKKSCNRIFRKSCSNNRDLSNEGKRNYTTNSQNYSTITENINTRSNSVEEHNSDKNCHQHRFPRKESSNDNEPNENMKFIKDFSGKIINLNKDNGNPNLLYNVQIPIVPRQEYNPMNDNQKTLLNLNASDKRDFLDQFITLSSVCKISESDFEPYKSLHRTLDRRNTSQREKGCSSEQIRMDWKSPGLSQDTNIKPKEHSISSGVLQFDMYTEASMDRENILSNIATPNDRSELICQKDLIENFTSTSPEQKRNNFSFNSVYSVYVVQTDVSSPFRRKRSPNKRNKRGSDQKKLREAKTTNSPDHIRVSYVKYAKDIVAGKKNLPYRAVDPHRYYPWLSPYEDSSSSELTDVPKAGFVLNEVCYGAGYFKNRDPKGISEHSPGNRNSVLNIEEQRLATTTLKEMTASRARLKEIFNPGSRTQAGLRNNRSYCSSESSKIVETRGINISTISISLLEPPPIKKPLKKLAEMHSRIQKDFILNRNENDELSSGKPRFEINLLKEDTKIPISKGHIIKYDSPFRLSQLRNNQSKDYETSCEAGKIVKQFFDNQFDVQAVGDDKSTSYHADVSESRGKMTGEQNYGGECPSNGSYHSATLTTLKEQMGQTWENYKRYVKRCDAEKNLDSLLHEGKADGDRGIRFIFWERKRMAKLEATVKGRNDPKFNMNSCPVKHDIHKSNTSKVLISRVADSRMSSQQSLINAYHNKGLTIENYVKSTLNGSTGKSCVITKKSYIKINPDVGKKFYFKSCNQNSHMPVGTIYNRIHLTTEECKPIFENDVKTILVSKSNSIDAPNANQRTDRVDYLWVCNKLSNPSNISTIKTILKPRKQEYNIPHKSVDSSSFEREKCEDFIHKIARLKSARYAENSKYFKGISDADKDHIPRRMFLMAPENNPYDVNYESTHPANQRKYPEYLNRNCGIHELKNYISHIENEKPQIDVVNEHDKYAGFDRKFRNISSSPKKDGLQDNTGNNSASRQNKIGIKNKTSMAGYPPTIENYYGSKWLQMNCANVPKLELKTQEHCSEGGSTTMSSVDENVSSVMKRNWKQYSEYLEEITVTRKRDCLRRADFFQNKANDETQSSIGSFSFSEDSVNNAKVCSKTGLNVDFGETSSLSQRALRKIVTFSKDRDIIVSKESSNQNRFQDHLEEIDTGNTDDLNKTIGFLLPMMNSVGAVFESAMRPVLFGTEHVYLDTKAVDAKGKKQCENSMDQYYDSLENIYEIFNNNSREVIDTQKEEINLRPSPKTDDLVKYKSIDSFNMHTTNMYGNISINEKVEAISKHTYVPNDTNEKLLLTDKKNAEINNILDHPRASSEYSSSKLYDSLEDLLINDKIVCTPITSDVEMSTDSINDNSQLRNFNGDFVTNILFNANVTALQDNNATPEISILNDGLFFNKALCISADNSDSKWTKVTRKCSGVKSDLWFTQKGRVFSKFCAEESDPSVSIEKGSHISVEVLPSEVALEKYTKKSQRKPPYYSKVTKKNDSGNDADYFLGDNNVKKSKQIKPNEKVYKFKAKNEKIFGNAEITSVESIGQSISSKNDISVLSCEASSEEPDELSSFVNYKKSSAIPKAININFYSAPKKKSIEPKRLNHYKALRLQLRNYIGGDCVSKELPNQTFRVVQEIKNGSKYTFGYSAFSETDSSYTVTPQNEESKIDAEKKPRWQVFLENKIAKKMNEEINHCNISDTLKKRSLDTRQTEIFKVHPKRDIRHYNLENEHGCSKTIIKESHKGIINKNKLKTIFDTRISLSNEHDVEKTLTLTGFQNASDNDFNNSDPIKLTDKGDLEIDQNGQLDNPKDDISYCNESGTHIKFQTPFASHKNSFLKDIFPKVGIMDGVDPWIELQHVGDSSNEDVDHTDSDKERKLTNDKVKSPSFRLGNKSREVGITLELKQCDHKTGNSNIQSDVYISPADSTLSDVEKIYFFGPKIELSTTETTHDVTSSNKQRMRTDFSVNDESQNIQLIKKNYGRGRILQDSKSEHAKKDKSDQLKVKFHSSVELNNDKNESRPITEFEDLSNEMFNVTENKNPPNGDLTYAASQKAASESSMNRMRHTGERCDLRSTSPKKPSLVTNKLSTLFRLIFNKKRCKLDDHSAEYREIERKHKTAFSKKLMTLLASKGHLLMDKIKSSSSIGSQSTKAESYDVKSHNVPRKKSAGQYVCLLGDENSERFRHDLSGVTPEKYSFIKPVAGEKRNFTSFAKNKKAFMSSNTSVRPDEMDDVEICEIELMKESLIVANGKSETNCRHDNQIRWSPPSIEPDIEHFKNQKVTSRLKNILTNKFRRNSQTTEKNRMYSEVAEKNKDEIITGTLVKSKWSEINIQEVDLAWNDDDAIQPNPSRGRPSQSFVVLSAAIFNDLESDAVDLERKKDIYVPETSFSYNHFNQDHRIQPNFCINKHFEIKIPMQNDIDTKLEPTVETFRTFDDNLNVLSKLETSRKNRLNKDVQESNDFIFTNYEQNLFIQTPILCHSFVTFENLCKSHDKESSTRLEMSTHSSDFLTTNSDDADSITQEIECLRSRHSEDEIKSKLSAKRRLAQKKTFTKKQPKKTIFPSKTAKRLVIRNSKSKYPKYKANGQVFLGNNIKIFKENYTEQVDNSTNSVENTNVSNTEVVRTGECGRQPVTDSSSKVYRCESYEKMYSDVNGKYWGSNFVVLPNTIITDNRLRKCQGSNLKIVNDELVNLKEAVATASKVENEFILTEVTSDSLLKISECISKTTDILYHNNIRSNHLSNMNLSDGQEIFKEKSISSTDSMSSYIFNDMEIAMFAEDIPLNHDNSVLGQNTYLQYQIKSENDALISKNNNLYLSCDRSMIDNYDSISLNTNIPKTDNVLIKGMFCSSNITLRKSINEIHHYNFIKDFVDISINNEIRNNCSFSINFNSKINKFDDYTPKIISEHFNRQSDQQIATININHDFRRSLKVAQDTSIIKPNNNIKLGNRSNGVIESKSFATYSMAKGKGDILKVILENRTKKTVTGGDIKSKTKPNNCTTTLLAYNMEFSQTQPSSTPFSWRDPTPTVAQASGNQTTVENVKQNTLIECLFNSPKNMKNTIIIHPNQGNSYEWLTSSDSIESRANSPNAFDGAKPSVGLATGQDVVRSREMELLYRRLSDGPAYLSSEIESLEAETDSFAATSAESMDLTKAESSLAPNAEKEDSAVTLVGVSNCESVMNSLSDLTPKTCLEECNDEVEFDKTTKVINSKNISEDAHQSSYGMCSKTVQFVNIQSSRKLYAKFNNIVEKGQIQFNETNLSKGKESKKQSISTKLLSLFRIKKKPYSKKGIESVNNKNKKGYRFVHAIREYTEPTSTFQQMKQNNSVEDNEPAKLINNIDKLQSGVPTGPLHLDASTGISTRRLRTNAESNIHECEQGTRHETSSSTAFQYNKQSDLTTSNIGRFTTNAKMFAHSSNSSSYYKMKKPRSSKTVELLYQSKNFKWPKPERHNMMPIVENEAAAMDNNRRFSELVDVPNKSSDQKATDQRRIHNTPLAKEVTSCLTENNLYRTNKRETWSKKSNATLENIERIIKARIRNPEMMELNSQRVDDVEIDTSLESDSSKNAKFNNSAIADDNKTQLSDLTNIIQSVMNEDYHTELSAQEYPSNNRSAVSSKDIGCSFFLSNDANKLPDARADKINKIFNDKKHHSNANGLACMTLLKAPVVKWSASSTSTVLHNLTKDESDAKVQRSDTRRSGECRRGRSVSRTPPGYRGVDGTPLASRTIAVQLLHEVTRKRILKTNDSGSRNQDVADHRQNQDAPHQCCNEDDPHECHNPDAQHECINQDVMQQQDHNQVVQHKYRNRDNQNQRRNLDTRHQCCNQDVQHECCNENAQHECCTKEVQRQYRNPDVRRQRRGTDVQNQCGQSGCRPASVPSRRPSNVRANVEDITSSLQLQQHVKQKKSKTASGHDADGLPDRYAPTRRFIPPRPEPPQGLELETVYERQKSELQKRESIYQQPSALSKHCSTEGSLAFAPGDEDIKKDPMYAAIKMSVQRNLISPDARLLTASRSYDLRSSNDRAYNLNEPPPGRPCDVSREPADQHSTRYQEMQQQILRKLRMVEGQHGEVNAYERPHPGQIQHELQKNLANPPECHTSDQLSYPMVEIAMHWNTARESRRQSRARMTANEAVSTGDHYADRLKHASVNAGQFYNDSETDSSSVQLGSADTSAYPSTITSEYSSQNHNQHNWRG